MNCPVKEYDFYDALANGWVGNTIYFWDGTNYSSSFYTDPAMLETWKGYWLFVYNDGLTLRVYRPVP